MVMQAQGAPERLVKSTERVRDLGEVFTPSSTVEEMLDLLPTEIWNPHPSANFMEPACGDGNFLEGILNRKLASVTRWQQKRALPAGTDSRACEFHALEALASIYAVDISAENVLGGTPGHEVGARDRLVSYLMAWHEELGLAVTQRRRFELSARWIVERNIQVGNMLAKDADGKATRRESLPLVEYEWAPANQVVRVSTTTFGKVMAESDMSGPISLFDTSAPQIEWEGSASTLHKAPIPAPKNPNNVPRNGNGLRRQ
jgi:hypothetical protein